MSLAEEADRNVERSIGVLLAHEFDEGTNFGALQTARRVQNPQLDFVAGNAPRQSKVSAVVRFEELPAAIERNRTQPQLGKTVVTLID